MHASVTAIEMSVRRSSLQPRASTIPRTAWRASTTLSGSAGTAISTSARSPLTRASRDA